MSILSKLFRKKSLNQFKEAAGNSKLVKSLTTFDLILMGIGVIVGTGIFVFTGIGAALYAGPALMISFVISGLTCAFAAMAYAEFASMVPVVGSAYTYSYVVLGEIAAWIVGWTLILEYSIAAAAVASGWSKYFTHVIDAAGIHIPNAIRVTPSEGGIIDLFGVAIIFFLTFILYRGTKESAKLNRILVLIKMAVVFVFIVLAAPNVNPNNWTPFAPYGWSGIVTGASFAFFAYLGFDILANSAEECKNPEKSLPRGILGSLAIVTVLYVMVTAIMTGVVPYTSLDTGAPVSVVLSAIGYPFGAVLTGIGIVFGLTAVVLVLLFSQIRLFMAMSRDGLLPPFIGKIHPTHKTPHIITIVTGTMISFVVGFIKLELLAELVNIGTLFAFMATSAGALILRFTRPNAPRPFKCPLPYLLMPLSIISCGYLMIHLSLLTWQFFFFWLTLGLIIYFTYGKKKSLLNK